jgi:hypothetical protein
MCDEICEGIHISFKLMTMSARDCNERSGSCHHPVAVLALAPVLTVHFNSRRHSMRRIFIMLLCAALLSVSAAAQSGRKQKKADPLPPVQGVNQPEARTVPETEVAPEADQKPKETPKTGFQIMSDMGEMGVPLYYNDTARIACLQELHKQLPGLQVSDGGSNKNRSDALRAAKDSDTVYVILLELVIDRMGTSSSGLELRFTLYEPKTGKQVMFGTGFPVPPQGIPSPPIGMSRDQLSLEWAGRDVAQRVIDKLKLKPGY